MIERILYSSPLFAGIFWIGCFSTAPFLAARLVTGRWHIPWWDKPDMLMASLVTFAIWGIIAALYNSVRRHFERES